MKKYLGFIMAAAMLLLCACGSTAPASPTATPVESAPAESAAVESVPVTGKTVTALASGLDISALTDCSFAASFKAEDVKLDENGALVVTMTVYDFECFDMIDVDALAEGDVLCIGGENIAVESISRDGQHVIVNGGPLEGGYDLYTEENGVYYELIMDAGMRFYALGEVTLPVSQDFVFTDNSDPQNQGQVFYAGDFITLMENWQDSFSESSTVVRVADGQIVEITRNYMP